MAPLRVSEQYHEEPTESKHDCMGTILCMLTCKDGYQLGQRQENGCQTCTCKKKTEAKNGMYEVLINYAINLANYFCTENVFAP